MRGLGIDQPGTPRPHSCIWPRTPCTVNTSLGQEVSSGVDNEGYGTHPAKGAYVRSTRADRRCGRKLKLGSKRKHERSKGIIRLVLFRTMIGDASVRNARSFIGVTFHVQPGSTFLHLMTMTQSLSIGPNHFNGIIHLFLSNVAVQSAESRSND